MKLGTSFTEVTVRTNVSVAVSEPSLTVTVMVAVPFWLAAGVMVTVRLAPLPPKTMLALGTSAVFDDEPDTVRLPAAVCASPTVNADRRGGRVLVRRLVGDVRDRRGRVGRRDRDREGLHRTGVDATVGTPPLSWIATDTVAVPEALVADVYVRVPVELTAGCEENSAVLLLLTLKLSA